jgi:C-terminal processing protease CtpA/Prc
MEDRDPEVRRRARETILALVPKRPEDPVVAERTKTEQFFNVQNWQAVQKQAMRVQIQRWKQQQKDLQKKQVANRDRMRLANIFVRRIGFRGVAAYGVRVPGQRQTTKGFMVQSVHRGTTANKMDLRAGDIVLRVIGIPVASADHFRIALGDGPDWSLVSFDVLRGGRVVTLKLPR